MSGVGVPALTGLWIAGTLDSLNSQYFSRVSTFRRLSPHTSHYKSNSHLPKQGARHNRLQTKWSELLQSRDHQAELIFTGSARTVHPKARARDRLSQALRSPLPSQVTTWAGPVSPSPGAWSHGGGEPTGSSIMGARHALLSSLLRDFLLQAEQTEVHRAPQHIHRALEVCKSISAPPTI